VDIPLFNDGTWRGEISSAQGLGNVYKNNIAYAIVGAGILANNAPFLGADPVDASNAWSNNLAFGGAPYMVAPDAFPMPANKTDADPLFVAPASSNFAVSAGSPAIGFGVAVPYWQQTTPGGIDVGACPRTAATCP
jgi:serralysin